MIGFYDYTVILTYLSLLSAGTGIVVALSGGGHPYLGSFFLLFSGLCDAFDGKVARTKPDRTRQEMNYGIQIDSLSDLVAFGVLPACIGSALLRTSPAIAAALGDPSSGWQGLAGRLILHAVLVLFILAAMIRLAYYNVTEQERQERETGVREHYLGLPVTSSALIFPFVLLLQYLTPGDITVAYIGVIFLTGCLFLAKFRLKKPSFRTLLLLVGVGAVEFLLMLLWKGLCR